MLTIPPSESAAWEYTIPVESLKSAGNLDIVSYNLPVIVVGAVAVPAVMDTAAAESIIPFMTADAAIDIAP